MCSPTEISHTTYSFFLALPCCDQSGELQRDERDRHLWDTGTTYDNGDVSAERGEACAFMSLSRRYLWLWISIPCMYHCLVAVASLHPLASPGAWMTEEVQVTSLTPGSAVDCKSLINMVQRCGKQQQVGERQVQTVAMHRSYLKKNRPRWWQAGRIWPDLQWRTEPGQGSVLRGQQHRRWVPATGYHKP